MRYAIYFTPAPGSPFDRFGGAVLGYDAATGARVPFPSHLGITQPLWEQLTEAPRRYGFHATLKAPFELAPGITEEDLRSAARSLAAGLSPVDAGVLALSCDGGFFALRPEPRDHAGLGALAQACVEALDACRAPLADEDRARRSPERLSARQRESLERWGYPYAGADFAFHMTLTDRVAETQRSSLRAVLADLYHQVAGPIRVDALTICRQDDRTCNFLNIERVALAAPAGD